MSRRSFLSSISFWNNQVVRATRKQQLPASALLERCIRPVLESLEQRTLLSADPAWQLDTALPYLPDTPLAPAPVLPQGVMAAGLTVPILHSNPSATAKIYLDFDGYTAMTWGAYSVTTTPAYSTDTDAANFSATELNNIQEIWERVAEKFSPFNVDVTTEDPGNLNNLRTAAVVIGGNGSWYGSQIGGASYIGSFSNSAPNQVWVFPDNLAAGAAKPVSEAIAHEVGHAFGLQHQSQYSGTTLVNEYNPGDASSAPIMGNSYSSDRGLWWNGPTPTSSTTIQDDLAVIASLTNAFGYKADDVGQDIRPGMVTLAGNAGTTISASGVIGRSFDSDWFSLGVPTGTVSLTLSMPRGAMLDAALEIRSASSVTYASIDVTPGTTESLTCFLPYDTYRVIVRSHGGYGDIGQYTLSGTIPTAPFAAAPSGLTATPISKSQVNLSWTDNSTNEGGFRIERSQDGVTWTGVAGTSANATSFSDVGYMHPLAGATTYYYRVSSYITFGVFSPSNVISTTTPFTWTDVQLDPTFGTAGFANSDWHSMQPGYEVVIQPDGKILVGGGIDSGMGIVDNALLARFNIDGSVDTTFGSNGMVEADWGGVDYVVSLALQSDGKIVVGGYGGGGITKDFIVARYNSDGTPDTTFGGTGTVVTDLFGSDDTVSAVLVQPDGRIVVVGATGSTDPDLAVVRYNPDGTLDTTFDSDGKVATNVGISPNLRDYAADAVLQPDGKIVVVGKSESSGGALGVGVLVVARYNADGSLDATFGGGDGIVMSEFAGRSSASAVALQGDKIVVGGTMGDHFGFARYNSDGSLDTSFGTGGSAIFTQTSAGWTSGASRYAMAMGADGRIVLEANEVNPSDMSRPYNLLMCVNPDGTPYSGFGTSGLIKVIVSDGFSGVAVQKDGRIVVTGEGNSVHGGASTPVLLVRYVVQGMDTVPIAPTNIRVASGPSAGNTVTWIDASSYETGFAVERSPDGISWTQIITVPANSTSYVDTTAVTGIPYYRVRAYNATGYSFYSRVATLVPPISRPTTAVATATSTTAVRLDWTDNSTQETGFKIERSTDGATWTQIATVGANVATYTASGLTAATTYYFRVCAYTATANSLYAGPVAATTYVLPAPTGVTATALSSTSIRINWTDASTTETGFTIWKVGSWGGIYTAVATVGPNTTTYTSTGLVQNASYNYYVTANSTAGASGPSSVVTATATDLPAAPSGLTATAISTSQINLAWTDNSSDESGFKIERSTNGGTTWTQIATVGVGVTTYNNTGLSAATSYSYRVCAYNSANVNSAYSNVVSATTLVTNPPTAPTALTAAVISNSQINLAWTDNSSNETGFKIERSTDGGTIWTQIGTVLANVRTYSSTGLAAGTTYSYRVMAYNAGATSVPTNVVTSTTYALAAPTGVTVTVLSSTSIRINWTDTTTTETGFTIWELGPWAGMYVPVATVGANITTYTRTELVWDTNYSYYVTATNASGSSAPSNTATARTTYLPSAPSALTATVISNYQINLAWTDNSTNESGFKIERSSDGGANWIQIATVLANIKTYSNTGLTFGTAYSYRVCAYNSTNENGSYSNVISATTFSNPPLAPTTLTATAASTSQINLAWADKSSDESGFKIERSSDGGASWTQIATVNPNILTYNNTGLAAGTTYSYRVSAYNAVATSLPTNTIIATTWAAMPPTGVTATVLLSTSIRVNWTDAASNETGFILEASTNGGTTWSQLATPAANAATYTLTGLTGNTSYRFRLRATNALGQSPNSALSTAVTTTYLPPAPSALTATVISNYQINLAWTDASTNESGFKIERSSDGGATWTQIATTLANVRTYNNTGLTFGTTYSYRIRGYNSTSENGAWSNVIAATTFSNPPIAPTTLTATAASTSQINLAWADKSSDESGFKVERSSDGGVSWTQIATTAAGITTYNNTGLSPGTAYTYRVSAYNGAATSAPTNTITATTWAAMPPTGVAATVLLSTSIRVNWTDAANNETGFVLEASTNGGTTWTQVATPAANAVTHTLTGLTGNTSYRFRLRATNALGQSPNSALSTAVTTTYLPPAPSGLTATVISNYQINLAWTDNSANESGFKIERSSDGGATWTQIATTLANVRTYNNTGLTFGTTYSYRIRGYNSTSENGAWSNVIVATTFSNPPTAPSALTASVISTSQINLAWNDNSSDETGFKIERSSDGGATWTQIATVTAGIKTYNNTGLAAGTAYAYRVTAYNAAATSAPTNTASGTTWAAMPPTGVTATVLLSTSIRVNWTDASNNETGFILEASTNGGTSWTPVASPAANAVTYTLTGLTPNTSYRFRLRATNALGQSPNSGLSTAVTTTYLPPAPSALTATVISNYQINLAWTDNSTNESGFKIERSSDGGATWTQIATTLANVRTYNNINLPFGTTYSYRVRGYNSTSENGAWSSVITATTFSNPPTAPTALTATVASISQINLAWTDNSSDESGFKIERSADGGANWTQIATVAAGLGTGTRTYNNTGLPAGTAYAYRVSASNAAATSLPTNTVTATTWAAMPPTAVTATVLLSTSIRVNWTDASSNETGFKLEQSSDGGVTWALVATPAANAVTYTLTGLSPNTAYRYRLRATNALGESPNSAVATGTTTYVPAAPSALTATVISNYQINLAWTDNSPNDNGFKIERSTDGVSWSQVGTTLAHVASYSSTGLTLGTSYFHRVRAVNATGENGGYSNVISATTFSNPPAAPSALTATAASTSQINLAWNDNSSDESGFKIERSADGGASWTQIGTTLANIRTYNSTGLATATSYAYRVSAYHAAATSLPTAIASGTTWATMPPTPVTATALSSTSVRVNWTDVASNEDGFKLEQSSDGTTWTLLSTLAANAATYTVTGLTPNTLYRYRLRAYNALGESPNSAVATVTTTYIPAAPSGLTATVASATQINLTWTDNSGNETGFKIERSSDGGASWSQIGTVATNIRTYSNSTGLAAGTTYSYRVRAVNAATENSPFSNLVTATTMPAAPTGLTATALAGAQIRLNWTNLSGESGYLIERSLNGSTWTPLASVAADVTSYSNTALSAGTRYYYRIRAYNGSGNGSYSTTVNTVALA